MSKFSASELEAMGVSPSKFELAFAKAIPSQGTLTIVQVALFVINAYFIVNCPFGSIWSILSMCVAVFLFVGNSLLIIDYKGASTVEAAFKFAIIAQICVSIAYLA